MIPLSAYVAVSAVLFITGLLGVLIRRNFIIVLMSVEIMLNAANVNLIAFSHCHCRWGSGDRTSHHHRRVPWKNFHERGRDELLKVVA
jgi:multisubunit Na+/H+ antiporter MnhC subunit